MTQRPFYRDTSSEMMSLLPLHLHTFDSCRFIQELNEARQILEFTEYFAIERGAPFERVITHGSRSLIGYSLILRLNSYLIGRDIQFSV